MNNAIISVAIFLQGHIFCDSSHWLCSFDFFGFSHVNVYSSLDIFLRVCNFLAVDSYVGCISYRLAREAIIISVIFVRI